VDIGYGHEDAYMSQFFFNKVIFENFLNIHDVPICRGNQLIVSAIAGSVRIPKEVAEEKGEE
jgi:hypothetical protein